MQEDLDRLGEAWRDLAAAVLQALWRTIEPVASRLGLRPRHWLQRHLDRDVSA